MIFPPVIENLPLESRIGVSTICLKGLPLEEAITQVQEAGFKALEVSPVMYQPPPRDTSESPSLEKLWNDVFSQERRRSLKERLADFALVTMHLSVKGLDSHQKGEREYATSQYLEAMRLAGSIGARIITMHVPVEPDGAKYTLEFAQRAVRYAEELDLMMGFEFFNREIIREVGSERLGLLFDIGHAARNEQLLATYDGAIARAIDDHLQHVLQFHAHGVHLIEGRRIDHLPIDENNNVDYESIMKVLKRRSYAGPIIFEIGVREHNASRNLQDCVLAKRQLLAHLAALDR